MLTTLRLVSVSAKSSPIFIKKFKSKVCLNSFILNKSKVATKMFSSTQNVYPDGIRIKGDIEEESLKNIANSIKITDKCTEKIKEIVQQQKAKKFLRLMVEGGGCSGYQYIFKIDDQINSAEDITLEKDDTQVVIDKLSLPFLEGAIIDFKDSMIKSSFTVSENPKAEISCSCGSSFSPKFNAKI